MDFQQNSIFPNSCPKDQNRISYLSTYSNHLQIDARDGKQITFERKQLTHHIKHSALLI
jgi:hypothetical protein